MTWEDGDELNRPRTPQWIRERPWCVNWIIDEKDRKRPVAPYLKGHAYPCRWRSDLPDDEDPTAPYGVAKREQEATLGPHGCYDVPEGCQSTRLGVGIILPRDRPPRDKRGVVLDWDDAECPETGEIHPVVERYIEEYGGDVERSQSGTSFHQLGLGAIPEWWDDSEFIAPIDDEPWGANEDLPQIEIYDGGRHVAMTEDGLQLGDPSGEPTDLQPCIDAIIEEFEDAARERKERLAAEQRQRDADVDGGGSGSGSGSGGSQRPPAPSPSRTREYTGPSIDDLRASKPADRSLSYHAVIEAFCEGYAGVLNWRLEGAAAALGQRDALSVGEIVADLRGEYRAGGSVGFDEKTAGRVEYDHGRAQQGEFTPPSWETLRLWGVLPPRRRARS